MEWSMEDEEDDADDDDAVPTYLTQALV